MFAQAQEAFLVRLRARVLDLLSQLSTRLASSQRDETPANTLDPRGTCYFMLPDSDRRPVGGAEFSTTSPISEAVARNFA